MMEEEISVFLPEGMHFRSVSRMDQPSESDSLANPSGAELHKPQECVGRGGSTCGKISHLGLKQVLQFSCVLGYLLL